MSPRHKLKYAPAAVDDMDEIFAFISEDNALAAENLLNNLDEQISKLSLYPRMGTVLAEDEYLLIQHGYRWIVVNPYIVFYRVLGDSVVVHRILHQRRDYLRELFGSA